MKKSRLLAILLIIVIMVSGCSGASKDDDNRRKIRNKKTEENLTSGVDEEAWKERLNTAKMHNAYNEALLCLAQTKKLPNGDEIEDTGLKGDEWAVLDIDKDGRDELIISITSTSMAGMSFRIFEYDVYTNQMKEQFVEFPSITFYDNGFVKAEYSHNHSLGMNLWPYSLYKYNAETDTYDYVTSCESWEKEFYPISYSDEAFPDEKDTDGDGVIYCCSGPDGEWDETIFGTTEEYEDYLNSLMGDTKEINYTKYALEDTTYKKFGKEYVSSYIEYQKEKGNEDKGYDMGIAYAMGNGMHTIANELTKKGIDITNEDEEGYTITYDEVVPAVHLFIGSGGSIDYREVAIPDVTIYGLYPGMDAGDAIQRLEDYGFEEEYGQYITGNGYNNFAITLYCPNGILESMTMYSFTGYTD